MRIPPSGGQFCPEIGRPSDYRKMGRWYESAAGRGARMSAHLKIRYLPALMRSAASPRVRPSDSGPSRTSAFGCGFNRSTQRIGQSVLPVSRSRASAGGVRSAVEGWH